MLSHMVSQGIHRLEKYLNIKSFHEKSVEMKFPLKSIGKALSD